MVFTTFSSTSSAAATRALTNKANDQKIMVSLWAGLEADVAFWAQSLVNGTKLPKNELNTKISNN